MTDLTPESALERIERNYRESLDRNSRIEQAWNSPETRAVRQFIVDDGNVDFREFTSHVGGIMEVVALVDEQGQPDADRIIPKVDELFAKYAVKEFAGGLTMTRRPQNRPYRPKAAAVDPRFPGDPGGPADLSSQAPMRTTSRR